MNWIDRRRLLLAAACATFAAAAVHSVALAQAVPPALAPASHFKNLQVLPKDISRYELRATMKGFALSLGVRCTFCHVGVEGQPLSTFDFPSDTNPHKNVARAMLRMTKRLNGELPTGSGPQGCEGHLLHLPSRREGAGDRIAPHPAASTAARGGLISATCSPCPRHGCARRLSCRGARC